MKVKHLKEMIRDWDSEDDIVFCEYSFRSEAYTSITDVVVKHCRPKKMDYMHRDCVNYELVDVRGSKVAYCNKWDNVLQFPEMIVCSSFKHMDDSIVYCCNCVSCNKNYTCNGLKGSD